MTFESLHQSALLLNGNLALLTVGVGPKVVAGAQQACYISTMISIASTMTGVLLSQHAQRKESVSASRSLNWCPELT